AVGPHFYAQAIKSLRNAEGFIAANNADLSGIRLMSKKAEADANRLLRMTKEATGLRRSTSEQAAYAVDRLKRRTANVDELMDQQAFDQKLDDADRVFNMEEAEVFRKGDSLILRLKGIEFPFGSSTLPTSSYGLMSKAADVIKSFGNPDVK